MFNNNISEYATHMSGVYRNITVCSVVPHNALDLARAYLSLVSCWAEPLSHALSTTGYLSDFVEPSLLKKYRIAWGLGYRPANPSYSEGRARLKAWTTKWVQDQLIQSDPVWGLFFCFWFFVLFVLLFWRQGLLPPETQYIEQARFRLILDTCLSLLG